MDSGAVKRPMDRDTQMYTAIGRVAEAAAMLEVMAVNVLGRLLGTKHKKTVEVTRRMGFLEVLGIIERLLDVVGYPAEIDSAFRATISRSRKAYERRNQILHALWVAEGAEPIFTSLSMRNMGKAVRDRKSMNQIEAIANELKQCFSDFVQTDPDMFEPHTVSGPED